MIFDRTLVRFRKDLLYKLQSYVVNMIISGSTLIGNLYCLNFFGGEGVDIAIDKTPIRDRWGLA